MRQKDEKGKKSYIKSVKIKIIKIKIINKIIRGRGRRNQRINRRILLTAVKTAGGVSPNPT